MTDRISALTVVLKKDMREDDVEGLVNAILHMKFVGSVTTNVADIKEHIAEMRVRQELGDKLWSVLYPKDKEST